MYAATLLADPTCLRLERIISSATSLTLVGRLPQRARPVARATGARLPWLERDRALSPLRLARAELPVESRYSRGVGAAQPQPLVSPSPRRAAWMLKGREEPKAEYRAFVEGLRELCLEVEVAGRLAREFSRMVKERCAGELCRRAAA